MGSGSSGGLQGGCCLCEHSNMGLLQGIMAIVVFVLAVTTGVSCFLF